MVVLWQSTGGKPFVGKWKKKGANYKVLIWILFFFTPCCTTQVDIAFANIKHWITGFRDTFLKITADSNNKWMEYVQWYWFWFEDLFFPSYVAVMLKWWITHLLVMYKCAILISIRLFTCWYVTFCVMKIAHVINSSDGPPAVMWPRRFLATSIISELVGEWNTQTVTILLLPYLICFIYLMSGLRSFNTAANYLLWHFINFQQD